MGFLVLLLGFIVLYYGIAGLPMMFDKGTGYFIYALFLESLMIALFIFCLNKYIDSGKWEQKQAKRKRKSEEARKRREEYIASAPERERIRQEERERARERERLRTTVVSTRLIGNGSADYYKSARKVMKRGFLGSLLAGSIGSYIGMSSAMKKNQNIRRFLVKYLDGHVEEKEAAIGSTMYEVYMAHLEWNE